MRGCDRILYMRRSLGVDVLGGIQQAICLGDRAQELGVTIDRSPVYNRVFENGVLSRRGIASSDKAVVVIARYVNQYSLHAPTLAGKSTEHKRRNMNLKMSTVGRRLYR